MKEKVKRLDRKMRDVMEGGSCQNQKVVNCPSPAPLGLFIHGVNGL